MKVLFVYPAFERHAQAHPELLRWVPCDEYLGPPSLGIANMAAVTPVDVEIEYIDDRIYDDEQAGWPEADLVAISSFTPGATRALKLGDYFRKLGVTTVLGGIFASMMPDEASAHFDTIIIGEGDSVWPQVIRDFNAGELKPRYVSQNDCSLEDLPPPRLDLYLDKESGAFCVDERRLGG